ncbi:MAG: helix-turn-helix transcriptional regulator [Clostridia bacterium]|nr:helix-turn-helix transcriptional regulator [Clostridia bacterium]
MDYKDFIGKRITALRLKKNVSERHMSQELGHGDSYIRGISSGRALPSMLEFLNICEYFNVTPKEFFNEETSDPASVHELCRLAGTLSDEDVAVLLQMAKRMTPKK